MLLALDYNLLFLCDITARNTTNQLKIKSLKAKKDEVFTNACFASNNRFIILAVKVCSPNYAECLNQNHRNYGFEINSLN